MKLLHIECIGGASGDMILGALIALGADINKIESELSAFLPDHFHIEVKPHESHGLNGVQAFVKLEEHHHHSHDHGHDHDHEHRSFKIIREMIESSQLPATVKKNAIAVFSRLAEAEGAVHNKPADDVHFHEVGATDSIVDIVGACLALQELGIENVTAGRLPLGTGTVECQHGTYPVPAPATVELLKGYPVLQTDEPYELVTPTGAALLTTWVGPDGTPATGQIIQAVYSFGHRKLDQRPNVLRAMIVETNDLRKEKEECLVLETNLDDMTPELVGVLMDKLLDAGALDVFITPVQMKKQRPGMLLTVLCRADSSAPLKDLIFTESTTFGIRQYPVERTVLARRKEEVETTYGTISVKIGTWKQKDITWMPELSDCIDAAREHQVAVRAVYDEATRKAGEELTN